MNRTRRLAKDAPILKYVGRCDPRDLADLTVPDVVTMGSHPSRDARHAEARKPELDHFLPSGRFVCGHHGRQGGAAGVICPLGIRT